MKLKIFRANQIVLSISLITFALSRKDSILHLAANTLMSITLIVMFWFIVNATSNFLELENKINEEIKNEETDETRE
jgi:hypothetical protein